MGKAVTPVRRKIADRIFENAQSRSISIVVAPVASGKSEILRQIVKLAEVAGVPRELLSVPRDGGTDFATHVLEDIVRPVDDRPARRLILIDEFQRFAGEDAERILQAASDVAGTSIIVASDLPLQVRIAGLRLKRQLIEYDMNDLALTRQEARELTRLSMADAMSRDFQLLVQATEGWVGAWRLIADRLATGVSLTRVANDFSGNFGLFADYFEEEILAHLSRELVDFVTKFGILSPLSIELASDVGGPSDRQHWEEARRLCPFLIHPSGSARELVPHPMFRHFLADRLRRFDPEAFTQTLHAAAEWFEKRRDWPEAIECLIAAGEQGLVVEKLRQNATEIFTRFGDATLLLGRGFVSERVFREIAPTIRPEAALIQRRLDPDQYTNELLIGPGASPEEEFKAILTYFSVDRFDAVQSLADRWLHKNIQDPMQRATVALMLSVACYAHLDHRSMRQALELASSEVARTNSPFVETWIALEWAMYHIEGARPTAARHAIEAVLNRPAVRGLLRHTLEIVLAHVEYRLECFESANELIGRSLAPGTRHATVDTMVIGWTTAARCTLRQSGLDDALILLEEAYAVIARRGGERGRLSLRLLACQLCLQVDPRGRLAFVRSEMEQIQAIAASTNPGRAFHEKVKIVMARLMYEQGELREANLLIQPIIRRTESSERFLRWSEASLIRIAIATAEGKTALALRMFWDCESATTDLAIRQMFIEEARLLGPTIPHLQTQVESSGFEARHRLLVKELARAVGIPVGDHHLHDAEALPSDIKLTRIEQRIMDLVAKGLSNKDIADRLSNSVPTVKWHLGNVFLKLGVKSRTAALIRLQSLNLLG